MFILKILIFKILNFIYIYFIDLNEYILIHLFFHSFITDRLTECEITCDALTCPELHAGRATVVRTVCAGPVLEKSG